MDRLLLLVVVATAASAVAALLQRRGPDAPVRTGWTVPGQLDRADFARPETPWLVAVFTSATCQSCAGVLERAFLLESSEVAVVEVEVGIDAAVHDRYQIDAVPLVVIADARGVTRAHHLGQVSATHLWGSLAEVREPGSTPEGCGDH
ncbi:MAG: hypothetical protein QF638_06175 [Acidimicrobiales bacterium]|jgi:hypothetical protein|nr:hypothetical protein [Acidimicrobiaceae bacterium]MDP6077759.1 hypothetical protein [Acidimicrobiales bacterium]HCV36512.1 hypothetical protein [Acidimicrobiaceae bacterium]HJO79499.1 hypothetical protein [Acidimicrobiales bacterium]|tara:strand:- start:5260 stop:5703 length:444 start_codon:yes stop_codon:yes gene_type:complete